VTDALFVQILDASIDALNEDRPTAVPEATKRRAVPGERITAPRMAVFLGNEVLDPPRQNSRQDTLARRRLEIAVQCTGVTDDVAELDESVAPMLAWATSVLGMSGLDGLAHYVRETSVTRQAFLDLDRFVIHATIFFECSYQTRRADLTRET
jgi:hypothetical protein